MNLPLVACFAGGVVLLVGSIRSAADRRFRIMLVVAGISLLAASGLFLTGNRRDELAGISYILVGGIVFWGLFVPALAGAFFVHRRKGDTHR